MLATGMDRDKRTRLFIDVGTNCEIVVSDGDRILSTAAPASTTPSPSWCGWGCSTAPADW